MFIYVLYVIFVRICVYRDFAREVGWERKVLDDSEKGGY